MHPVFLGGGDGGGGRQLNHVSCEIYGGPEQGVVVFLGSLKSTGTDESAQNDNVLSSRPDRRFPRDAENTDPCLKVCSSPFK